MHTVIGGLVLGVVAGEGARKIGWRPLLKQTFKQGIVLSRKVQAAALDVRREAEQLVSEARMELDGPTGTGESSETGI